MILIFTSVGSLVTYGRNSVGYKNYASLLERWEIINRWEFSANSDLDDIHYNSWGRFCYLPPQVTAMNYYDEGEGGDELKLIPWIFVPRIVNPNKPIITQSGSNLYTKITGNVGSSTGQGIFSSGYYNGGWLGVFLASALCGWLLAQASAIANAIITRRAVLLLPFALLGVYMAFRIDGDFLADYMGTFIYLLYPLLIGLVVVRVSRRSRAA